ADWPVFMPATTAAGLAIVAVIGGWRACDADAGRGRMGAAFGGQPPAAADRGRRIRQDVWLGRAMERRGTAGANSGRFARRANVMDAVRAGGLEERRDVERGRADRRIRV